VNDKTDAAPEPLRQPRAQDYRVQVARLAGEAGAEHQETVLDVRVQVPAEFVNDRDKRLEAILLQGQIKTALEAARPSTQY
jgi:hypothetical protein